MVTPDTIGIEVTEASPPLFELLKALLKSFNLSQNFNQKFTNFRNAITDIPWLLGKRIVPLTCKFKLVNVPPLLEMSLMPLGHKKGSTSE